MSVVLPFLVLLGPVLQDASPALFSELPERVEFAAADEVREEGFSVEVPHDGRLYLYATSVAGDPRLLVFDGTSELTDDDGGGGKAACLELDVERGQFVEVLVSAAADGRACVVELGASLAAETEASAALAASVHAELDRIDLSASGASRAVAEAVDRLPTDPAAIGPATRSVAQRVTTLPRHARTVEIEATARGILYAYAARHLPPSHPERILAATFYATVLKDVERFDEALALEQELLEHHRSLHVEEHRDVRIARLNLAATLYLMGELDAAAAEFRDLYERTREAAPPGDALLSAARQNLAAVELLRGYVRPAAELYAAELASMAEGSTGALALATVRVNYARALLELGRPDEAEPVLAEAVRTLRAELPPEDPALAACERDHGLALAQLGDLDAARLVYERVVTRQAAAYPADHPEVLRARQSLAHIVKELGDPETARTMLEEIVEAQERAGRGTQRDALVARSFLALTLRDAGDEEEAIAALEAVLERIPASYSPSHPLRLSTLSNLAGTYSEIGQLERARPLQESVLERTIEALPATSPVVLRARNNLAWTLVRQGDLEGTAAQLRASTQALLERLARFAPDRSAREIEGIVRRSRADVDQALSIVAGMPQGELRDALEAELFALVEAVRTVGIAQRRARKLLTDAPSEPAVSAALEAVRAAEADVVRQTRAGGDEILDAVRRRDAAQRALRAALRTASSEAADELARFTATPFGATELAARLQPDEAALGFWRYERKGIDTETGRLIPPVDGYLAWVVRPSGLTRIELGPASAIDAAIDRWRDVVLRDWERGVAQEDEGDPIGTREGEALRELLLDPLLPALGEARRIRCAPDDAVFLVPFDALPDDDGRATGDTLRFVYRPDLTRVDRALAPSSQPTLLAMGGIEYDRDPAARGASGTPTTGDGVPVRALRSAGWRPGFSFLADSESEVRALAHSFEVAFPDASASVLTGRDASRRRFEELAPSARYLHVATHAFFAPESIPSMRDAAFESPAADGGDRALLLDAREQVRGFAPMLLCGLAFAGANRTGAGDGDLANLMTAEELAGLDLSECELAVLSACETSVGVRRAGQGVASLQSALHAAGVRASITSLWRVPDAATKELMQHFYRALWIDGASTSDALWQAKRRLRDRRDPRGRPVYTTRDWAAWVLAGDR